MGAGAAKLEVTKYSRMTIEGPISGIEDWDRIQCVFIQSVQQAEEIRYQTLTSRELLLRISKVNLYKDATILDAFKVWAASVGACNNGDLKKVSFSVSPFDPIKAAFKVGKSVQKDVKEKNSADIKDKVSAGIGSLMSFGSKVIKGQIDPASIIAQAQEVLASALTPQVKAYADYGQCYNYKLFMWTKILTNYIHWLEVANKVFPQIMLRIKFLFDKCQAFKDDIPRIKEIFASLKNISTQDKMIVMGKLGVGIGQSARALKVGEQFLKWIPEFDKEMNNFMSQYEKVFQDQAELAQKVFNQQGIQPYYNKKEQFTLKCKINKVSAYLNLKLDNDLVLENTKLKEERISNRPRLAKGVKLNDVFGEENVFPKRFRWMDSTFFDTNLSGISITLQECEAARKLGGDARKKMIILAGVDKFIKETVTSAFEIWVWELSSKCEGKLNALKLRLIDESPYLEGENLEKDIKPLLTEEGTTFKENLHKWLEYFTPMQFQKLDNMWKDYKSRQILVMNERRNILNYTKTLSPPEVYSALASLDKNLLCLKVYRDRAESLWVSEIISNGEQGDELFEKSKSILDLADTHGSAIKDIKLKEIGLKHCPGYIANENDLKARQEQFKLAEEQKNKRKGLYNDNK